MNDQELKQKITEKREMQETLSKIRNSLTKEELLEIAAKRGIKVENKPNANIDTSSYITEIATLKARIKALQADLNTESGKSKEKSITEEIHNLRQQHTTLVQKMSKTDINDSKIMQIISTGEHAVSVQKTKALELSLNEEKQKQTYLNQQLQISHDKYQALKRDLENRQEQADLLKANILSLKDQMQIANEHQQQLASKLEKTTLNNRALQKDILSKKKHSKPYKRFRRT